jgi:hypothetical protein
MHRHERRASKSKRIRETEAEAVAFVVCEAVGLSASNSVDLHHYIHLYSGDKDTLAESLEHVPSASAEILAAIMPSARKCSREAPWKASRCERTLVCSRDGYY